MHYLADFREKWRPLVGASLGLGSGVALQSFIMGVFAPYLLSALGWSKADFAMLGVLSILVLFAVPVVGRLADVYGVRKVAAVGVVAVPLNLVAMSLLTGPLYQYAIVLIVQMTLCATTSAAVYTRLIVQNFDRSRGGALALAVSMPAVVGAIGSPLAVAFIGAHGWRAGFLAVAAFAAVTGFIGLLCIPPTLPRATAPETRETAAVGKASKDYGLILRNPTFWILFAAAFLVSLPQVLTNSQLAIVLTENGASPALAGSIVSIFAIGVIIGRVLAGIALDRFPAEMVAAVGLSLPGFGMFLLASPFDQPLVLASAILLVGLAFGAEGDVIAYLVVKHFGIRIYSTVIGLTFAAIGGAATFGAVALSESIRMTGGYGAFLVIGGTGVLLGSLLFLVLGRRRPLQPVVEPDDQPLQAIPATA
ncbi:MAG TPA: MFS transporter [Sphingobium sp.]|uniref:MFS transporter n=1 Tax=Sphingobium sp. TaxID=1912891 RepID=UPI002ED1EED3